MAMEIDVESTTYGREICCSIQVEKINNQKDLLINYYLRRFDKCFDYDWWEDYHVFEFYIIYCVEYCGSWIYSATVLSSLSIFTL